MTRIIAQPSGGCVCLLWAHWMMPSQTPCRVILFPTRTWKVSVCFNAKMYYTHIWKDHRESAKDRSTWVVNTRVQLILGQIGRPIAPLEFKFLLRNGPIGSHGKQEDDAFARLYRGYDATCLDSWVSIPPSPPLAFLRWVLLTRTRTYRHIYCALTLCQWDLIKIWYPTWTYWKQAIWKVYWKIVTRYFG